MTTVFKRKLAVGFLWHFHQPDYRDPLTGAFQLPWVRLHATFGYNDMLDMALGCPDAPHMLNFTPVLLDQLMCVAAGHFDDLYLQLSRLPPADLSLHQRRFILEYFFQANPATQILPYRRYRELYLRRERLRGLSVNGGLVGQFADRDIRDIQVWFNLCWMGRSARRNPAVSALLDKGNDFTEDDKAGLLEVQAEVVRGVLDKVRSIAGATRSELTFTPFYHPIAPLLCDTEAARSALPNVPLPRLRFQRPEDVDWQVREGMKRFAKFSGTTPAGMWPAEGSVSDAAVRVFAAAGVKWLVTDEENCLRSSPGVSNPLEVHYAHRLAGVADCPAIFFRHRDLSDAIGFRYQMLPGATAAADLVGRLEHLAGQMTRPEHQMIVLALDGENPWNYYPDGGEGLLNAVNAALGRHSQLHLMTISDFLAVQPPVRLLDRLHSGSWINADFHIWIGDPVKNRAWDLLAEARRIAQPPDGGEALKPDCAHHIHIAEGSDWFWWYGEPNHTPTEHIFDLLFRGHLQQVYRCCGLPVPEALLTPLTGETPPLAAPSPSRRLHPNIDGNISSYYDWLGAVTVDRSGELVRPSLKYYIERLHFGNDEMHLFLRVDFNAPAETALQSGCRVKLILEEPHHQVLELIGAVPDPARAIKIGCGMVLEAVLSLERLKVEPGDVVAFYLVLEQDGGAERFPTGREVRGRLFDSRQALMDWFM